MLSPRQSRLRDIAGSLREKNGLLRHRRRLGTPFSKNCQLLIRCSFNLPHVCSDREFRLLSPYQIIIIFFKILATFKYCMTDKSL